MGILGEIERMVGSRKRSLQIAQEGARSLEKDGESLA